MANNLKGYDGFQVLRSVFDVDKNCLRVCVVDGGGTGPGTGPIEVIIDHTSDSIRLGDGTALFTSTSFNGKIGLDVSIIDSPTVATPIITNITIGVVNTQFSHSFNANTKRYVFRARNGGKVNFSFISGNTGSEYITLRGGAIYTEDDMKNNGALTIYFQVNKADIIEILEWT